MNGHFHRNPTSLFWISCWDKDGTEVYSGLLAEGLDSAIPVIFISALAQDLPPTPPRAKRKYALIGKPFDPEELVHQLGDLVRSRQEP